MRKRIIPPVEQQTVIPVEDWLDVEEFSDVEITSEDAAHPIESALLPGAGSGYKKATRYT